MNGVDFPVAKVLDGIAAAQEAGLGPIKINMVVRRGINETSDPADGPLGARGRGHILRFIEYMDVGHTNGWRLDEVVPAAEIVAAIVDAEMPLEPMPPRYRGEVATAGAIVDGGGEVGVIASVTAPVLRRLHPGPDLGRGPALHVPLHGRGARPPAVRAARRGAVGRRACATRSPPSGASATTATPSCGPRRRRRPAAGRDVRDGRLRSRLACREPCPPRVHSGGELVDTLPASVARSSWTSALTRPRGPAVPSVLPEGAVRDRRHRDHIKGLRSTPVASGASLSRACGSRPTRG